MRQFFGFVFSIIFTVLLIPQPALASPSIAILELDAKGGVSSDEASIITDRLRAQLLKTNMFQVLERSKMEALLREQGFQQSVFCDDTKCKAQIGKLLGVEGLVIGSVSRLDTVYTLSVRVLDVNRGVILREEFYDCECALKDVLTQVAPHLVERLVRQPSSTPTSLKIPVGNTALPQSNIDVFTLAGNGWGGLKNGSAALANFNLPMALLLDSGNDLLIADTHNHQIRKLSGSGYVSHLAGSPHGLIGGKSFADGSGNHAIFHLPYAMARHPNGLIYIADTNNHRIRVMNAVGEVSTFVGTGVAGYNDGNPAVAQFNRPQGIAIDKQGIVYVADTDNHSIRKITANGQVTTVAGNGKSGFTNGRLNQSQLNFPTGLLFSPQGDLFIADTFNHSIRKLSSSGELTTIAGNGREGFQDGPQSAAEFRQPRSLALGAKGSLYIADTQNHRIRELTAQGNVITLAGNGKAEFADGNAAVASFHAPMGLVMGADGNLYVADSKNQRIRKIVFR